MAKKLLAFLNFLVNLAVSFALMICVLFSAYALWDNSRVYAKADGIQSEMLKFKPEASESGEKSASFEDLLKVNSDIRAWISLDNTKIDYPVLQGRDNLSYINTDVYGNFALAGSIYLDSRCSGAFEDWYSLLYGHHMENSRMFGDLDLYKDRDFFEKNSAGRLVLADRSYRLEIFACMTVPASEKAVFSPLQWKDDASGLIGFAEENAENLRGDAVETLREGGVSPRIIAMSTCSSEYTDARTVVLAVMRQETAEDGSEDKKWIEESTKPPCAL